MSSFSKLKVILPAVVALGFAAGAARVAHAQVTFSPDTKSSLAWWQINPHMNHLWATTCPQEPSWRPGEGRSGGWSVSQAFRPPKHGDAAVSDTTIIPLYPRRRVRSVCTPAVSGELTIADTANWRGIRGWVAVNSTDLTGGDGIRDAYTEKAVTEVNQFPSIKFQIDSVINTRETRDTLHGTAVGVFTFRNVSQPMTAAVRAWHDPTASGALRVMAKFHFPARDLIKTYGVSGWVLGMGVASNIWYDVFGGADLILRPAGN
jgi:hypothetical protein